MLVPVDYKVNENRVFSRVSQSNIHFPVLDRRKVLEKW